MNILNEFKELISDLSNLQLDNFSGIGLLLYSNLDLLNFLPMKNNEVLTLNKIAGKEKIFNFIKNNCVSNSYFHDGFHFINEHFELTHLSCYLSPRIDNKIVIEDKYGSRFRTAIYSSVIEGVESVGIVGKSYGKVILEKGKIV